MWIFTPDVALNSEYYKSIDADGVTPVLTFELPDGDTRDSIVFDDVETAVKAFDAVMNGIGANRKSVFLREAIDSDGNAVLLFEYDLTDYSTRLTPHGPCRITDPREWDLSQPIMVPIWLNNPKS